VLTPKISNMNEIIERTGDMLQRLIGEDIRLEFDLARDLAPVRVDRAQMQQVLMNLVVNACDAMPDGGRLKLSTRNVLARLEIDRSQQPFVRAESQDLDIVPVTGKRDQQDMVVVSVVDTGLGMTDETMEHLFEPFFTTKRFGKGTGLGLSTVDGIVQQSGGYVKVTSEPGEGTRFDVHLPALPHDPAASTSTPRHLPVVPLSHGDETLLLVEDDPAVRRLMSELLRNAGYRVLEAADGAMAMTANEQHDGRIDMLITDVVMPGMNGGELAERLQALRPELLVMYVTGYTHDPRVQRSVADAGAVLVYKPVSPGVLARHVRDLLDGMTRP
jgi:CheY-like chemotaxis protein